MTKLKQALAWLIVLLVVPVIVCGGALLGVKIYRDSQVNRYDFLSLEGLANKTILFIGDGMGFNHIKVTSAYYDKDMYMNNFQIKGSVTTFSNALLGPTDSAAAGSALSTGKKFDNKEVARHKGKDVETLGEYSKKLGLGVGIVTTDDLDGATPASFSAHANKRGDSAQIISSQLESNIDLFLGKGFSYYNNRLEDVTSAGYKFVSDYSFLSNEDDKILGAFSSVPAQNGTNQTPTLEMLTEFAIDFMEEKHPNGYFLMIEGAHIDKKSHDNDIVGMAEYLDSFDKSIKIATERFKNIDNSAIFVTADHETGGLRYSGQSKEKIKDSLYTRDGHSSANVPYFMFLNSNKQVDLSKIVKPIIDNTDVSKILRAMMKPAN